MQHIFKLSGQHVGFLKDGYVFDTTSRYLGWVEKDGTVWTPNGTYVGELVDGAYILRNGTKMQPMPKMPKMFPMTPMPPMAAMARMPRLPQMGWIDAIDSLGAR